VTSTHLALVVVCVVAYGSLTHQSTDELNTLPQNPGRFLKGTSDNAGASQSSAARTIEFSGYEWWVKTSRGLVGPGPNRFDDRNVDVDDAGRLHLRISRRSGVWTCAEVVSSRSFGFGTYRFSVPPSSNLDVNAVVGMFTWDVAAQPQHYREIDIELSQWGDPTSLNAQFVVQPHTRPGGLHRFQFPLALGRHQFTWTVQDVEFESSVMPDPTTPSTSIVERHIITTGVPPAGLVNARVNLWLVGGNPPEDESDMEVVISRFEFVPLQ
jgi:hypothetical protein